VRPGRDLDRHYPTLSVITSHTWRSGMHATALSQNFENLSNVRLRTLTQEDVDVAESVGGTGMKDGEEFGSVPPPVWFTAWNVAPPLLEA